MKYEEFEERLTNLLQKPDSALALVKPLLDDVKKDYEQIITLTEKVEKQDSRIKDLQDTNIKLFLSQTGQKTKTEEEEEEDEELTGADAIDAFVNKLSEKDKEE